MELVAKISESGITAPTYAEVLEALQGRFKTIYGEDVNLENDTADGQFLAIMASAIHDANAAVIASYSGYAPTTASGVMLSSIVKTNGIARRIAGYSMVDLRIVGQAGTTIVNGQVSDEENENKWRLPETVVIPISGEVTVTATCTEPGDIDARENTLTKILTPTRGWQSVSNPNPAATGAAIETDAQLKARQAISTALPARSVMEGVLGTVANLTGVTDVTGFDNDTSEVDERGIAPHSIAVIVEGGDVQEIAEAIFLKKGPGTGTFGEMSLFVSDSFGIRRQVSFSRPDKREVKIRVTVRALDGYETHIGEDIRASVHDYIAGLEIGEALVTSRLYLPANLNGEREHLTYRLLSVETDGGDGESFTANDVDVMYNQVVVLADNGVEIVVS